MCTRGVDSDPYTQGQQPPCVQESRLRERGPSKDRREGYCQMGCLGFGVGSVDLRSY